jgi:hypothetical protein
MTASEARGSPACALLSLCTRPGQHTTGNRGYFVSNKPVSPMNTGLGVSNRSYVGVPGPNRVPNGHVRQFVPESRKPLSSSGFSQWRDPDSNRGHHDFQRVVARHACAHNACKITTSRGGMRGPMPLVSPGSVRVWDFRDGLKSQRDRRHVHPTAGLRASPGGRRPTRGLMVRCARQRTTVPASRGPAVPGAHRRARRHGNEVARVSPPGRQ